MPPTSAASGFSRPLRVDALEPAGRTFEWQASEAERIDVAGFLGLDRLDGLTVAGRIDPSGKDEVRLSATFVADVVQTCVVTLEPVATRIADTLDRTYALHPRGEPRREVDLAPEAEDPPDLAEGGVVDVGAAVVEAVALAIDPYPRKPGAVLEYRPDEQPDPGPFAALAKLKDRL